jgi:hypothetical protein
MTKLLTPWIGEEGEAWDSFRTSRTDTVTLLELQSWAPAEFVTLEARNPGMKRQLGINKYIISYSASRPVKEL